MEWPERLPLIVAIVRKDLLAARWWVVAALAPALVGLFLSAPLALNTANPAYYQFGYRFVWYDSSLRSYYGLSALLTSVGLGLAFSHVYTGEVHRGTIRSVILYPVNVVDIVLAKLASGFGIAFLTTFPIFLGFLLPFFLLGLFPAADFLAIYFMTLFMGIVALATGVFLSLILTYYAGRMAVSPSTMGNLFLLLAVLLTELVVTTVGDYFLNLSSSGNVFPSQAAYDAVANFARAISVLSPQHVGARILGDLFGTSALWPDIHVVVPVFLVVVVGGGFLARRLYPDLFVR